MTKAYMSKAEVIKLTPEQQERLHQLMLEWPRVVEQDKKRPCDCERLGCPLDHSEYYRRKAALERLIDREAAADVRR